jgi:hypothetical protein
MPAELPEDDMALEEEKPGRPTGDFLLREFRPSLAIVVKGKAFNTNRWGMRDKDYELKPPPGTCRIALMGASPEVGSGIAYEEVWQTILEDHLNRENDQKKIAQYEILNFSVGGYTPLQRLRALETKAFSFNPDIVFYTAHPVDQGRSLYHLAKMLTRGTEIPYDYLKQVVHEAGIEGETNITKAYRALRPYGKDVMSWIYRRIVELCRQRGIVPVYVFLPEPTDVGAKEIPTHLQLAKEAGFLMVDLSDLYEDKDKPSMWVSETDRHPNAVAHKLIADRLYKELQSNPALLQKSK